MLVQIVVGGLGFYFHLESNLRNETSSIWDDFVFGAPIFAPLLFANLALLAMLGLWDLSCKFQEK